MVEAAPNAAAAIPPKKPRRLRPIRVVGSIASSALFVLWVFMVLPSLSYRAFHLLRRTLRGPTRTIVRLAKGSVDSMKRLKTAAEGSHDRCDPIIIRQNNPLFPIIKNE